MTKPAAYGEDCVRNRLRPQGKAAMLALACLLAACGSDKSADPGATATLDHELRALAVGTLGLTGDPASPRGARQVVPDTDPMVKLGQLLFFSQTFGAGYDVSCGTCHHPDFGGSDGLSISVGVVPKNAATVGPGRQIDPLRDLDPSADGGPNMHRNSITTFNAALFDRALMFDGRVFVLDAATESGGHGQRIRTPESGQAPDVEPLDGLMQFTMKGPIVNDNEMRSFLYTDLPTPTAYREHLMMRLRGTVDTQYNPIPEAAANWLARFRAAFGQPAGTADELITMLNVQRALAAYIKSKIFVDTPWRRYLAGDTAAISTAAKQGALLFLATKAAGGLGCGSCHSGNRFTDEAFHNTAFPQFGRGFGRSERHDLGRWLSTRAAGDVQAFRTPSLLNVVRTAPYGHVGSFATLEQLLAYHANPRQGVEDFDFTLNHLEQFRGSGVQYPEAEEHTRQALARSNFVEAEARLPARQLSGTEVSQLVAFLSALTDDCVATPACIRQWQPTIADDPDGHTLIRDRPLGTPASVDAQSSGGYSTRIQLEFAALPARTTFSDVQSCTNRIAAAANTGQDAFVQRSDPAFGVVDRHSYPYATWFPPQQSTLEVAMIAGGVTAAYLDDDCWPDLAFAGGDPASGMRFYRNDAGTGFSPVELLTGTGSPYDTPTGGFSGTALADLNGDYRRELVLGNVHPGEVRLYGSIGSGQYGQIATLPLNRPTFGISFAPLDSTGFPYMYLAHWAGGSGTNGSAPALWRSDGTHVYPWDKQARTTSATVDQRFNFTPKFADFNADGRIDMAIASDFSTSQVLRNVPDGNDGFWHFENETAYSPITDENGMGSALLDIDNDGNLEWFVTSILDPMPVAASNWGRSGNRLYRNNSTAQRLGFTDITTEAGVRDGHWGWGACAADFNNDGFVDLFHVNGFGYIPDDVATTDIARWLQEGYSDVTAQFQRRPSRLFINNGNGTFLDQAAHWGISAPSEGRGVTCPDFDRDGDVDVVVFDHSSTLQFFENKGGSGEGRRFIGVRLVGAAPNTDAIGARVHVTADVGRGRGVQTQLRLAEANSNFNSQNLPDLYFGLGTASVVSQLRVVWPGGTETTCTNVAVNQFLVIDQRELQEACPAAPVVQKAGAPARPGRR